MSYRVFGAGLGILFGAFVCVTGWAQGAQVPRASSQRTKTLRLFVIENDNDKMGASDKAVEIQPDDSFAPPRLQDKVLYIPLRPILRPYSETKSGNRSIITVGDRRFEFTDGKTAIVVDGMTYNLSAPVRFVPVSAKNPTVYYSTMVPADFFEKVFGAEGKAARVDDKVYVKLPSLAQPSPPLSPPAPPLFSPPYSGSQYQSPPYVRSQSWANTVFLNVFWVVMVAVLIIGVAIAAQVSQRNTLNRVYGLFAQRVDGQLHEGSLWTFPSVTFAHDGSAALLDIYSTGGKNSTHYSQLTFTFYHNSPFRCEIYPEGFFQEIGKFFGMQDIEVGYRLFDDHFIVKSDDLETVRNFLNAAVQQELLKLKRLRGNDHVYLSMNSSRLLIKKLSLFTRLEDLVAFYEASVRICDELMTLIGTNGAGAIQILEVSFDGTETAPTCQICGDEITSDRVTCRRCRTPHHRDCWEYNGGCAVYACKERRYTVSK